MRFRELSRLRHGSRGPYLYSDKHCPFSLAGASLSKGLSRAADQFLVVVVGHLSISSLAAPYLRNTTPTAETAGDGLIFLCPFLFCCFLLSFHLILLWLRCPTFLPISYSLSIWPWMARKRGNTQKKGVSDTGSALHNRKERVNAAEFNIPREEELLSNSHPSVALEESINVKLHGEAEMKCKQRSQRSPRREKQAVDTAEVNDEGDINRNSSIDEAVPPVEGHVFNSNPSTRPKSCSPDSLNAQSRSDNTVVGNLDLSDTLVFRSLRSIALYIMKASNEWLERCRPLFVTTRRIVTDAYHNVQQKIKHAYPFILKWVMTFTSILLMLGMMWLDCVFRGIDSFLRMGTASIFSVLWCGVLSVIAMVGIFKFLLVLAVDVAIGIFIGFTAAVILMGISGVVLLWFYGSFWTTMLIVFSGGSAFMLGRERFALFIATLYSVYCAWIYVGWLGLTFALNLAFVSSEVLLIVLSDKINERRDNGSAEQSAGFQGQSGFFSGESMHTSASVPTEHDLGTPSTSGSDPEATPESEIVRLLNCRDYYTALGFSRFGSIDPSVLKREYKKKAMLVHPDKNMGNEKAADAFKKLQNAYEVLLDSNKRKSYDDELRREELLSYFRQFQETSQKSRRHGLFTSGYGRGEADAEDPLGESRQIACRKCGSFHVWASTKKLKSRARWCQDCKDFHPAKDGDGWVEQSSHPLLFGMVQKMDPPAAYVCANSKIYNATEWYICQGMRCPVNTHKPSFHVNSSITSKHATGRGGGSSGQRGGGMPTPNMEENMTEEEFLEWLQNAVQAGMFNNFSGSPSGSQPGGSGSTSKGGGSSSGGNSKRKKKGKK